MPNNLFITGKIRIGKSTLLKEAVSPFKNFVGGFFVQRIFVEGQSKAFRLVNFVDEDYLPNREVQAIDYFTDLIAITGENKVVYYDVFRTVGVKALKQAVETKQMILMDELGRMEAKIPEFTGIVFKLLDSDMPVLGVLKKESNHFLDKIKKRADVKILDLDEYDKYSVQKELNEFLAAFFLEL